MKKINKSDKKIIEKYFNEDVFKSCCEDYIKHKKYVNKGMVIDMRKHTTTTGVDGVTTGIVCDVDFDEENGQLYLYLFVEGVFRWTVADETTRTALIDIEQDLRQNSKGEIEGFDFLKARPFTLKIVKSVVGMFNALPPVDETVLNVYYRLIAA